MMTDCRYDMLWLEGVLRILESWNRQLASCSLLVLAPSVAGVLPHVTSSVLLGVTSYIDLEAVNHPRSFMILDVKILNIKRNQITADPLLVG